jgi:hypothetical protein
VPQDGSYAERDPGAYHGADIPYVFGNLSKFGWAWTDADRKLSDIMSAYWVNFAIAGTPNGVGLPYWDSFSTASPAAMRFDVNVGMDQVPNRARLDFLDRFYGREKLFRWSGGAAPGRHRKRVGVTCCQASRGLKPQDRPSLHRHERGPYPIAHAQGTHFDLKNVRDHPRTFVQPDESDIVGERELKRLEVWAGRN